MVEIYLIRHGQTVYNVERRIQGMADSALTPAGRESAQALGRGLMQAGVVFDAAFASDLTRAQDTASLALAAAAQYLPVQTELGLREEFYAHFEGQPIAVRTEALRQRLPEAKIKDLTLLANGVHALDADAEDANAVQTRFDKAMRKIAATDAKRVMVVAHGTAILLWLRYIGYPSRQNALNNASVTRLHFDAGQFSVQAFDSLAYVQAGTRK